MSSSTDEKLLHNTVTNISERTTPTTRSSENVDQTELLSEADEKRLVRKIDTHLLPVLLVVSGLQFLDKTSLAFSAILGLRKTLHLVGEEYNWTSSIFYVGFAVACYPIAWCFVKLPLGKFLSVVVCAWGGILTLHAVARDFGQLMILRTLLGAFESPITPGFSLITSMWYTPREHVSRHCYWMAGNSSLSILGCLIAYGALQYNGPLGHFRLLFLILGLLTVACGLSIWFLLPDSPEKAYFLSPSEKSFAALRPRKFQRTSQLKRWNRKQFIETLKDPKSWWFFIFLVVTSIPAGALTTFGAIIIEGFGFSPSQTVLMMMPTNAVILFSILAVSWITPRVNRSRLLIMALLDLFAIVGCLMIMIPSQNKRNIRLAGIWFMAFIGPSWPLMLSVFASNTAGFTKKSTTSAILFIGYCAGNIAGPQFFLANEAPRYPTAYKAILACLAIAIVMLIGLRVYLDLENKRRDHLQGTHISAEDIRDVDLHTDEALIEIDETDRENMSFRYAL